MSDDKKVKKKRQNTDGPIYASGVCNNFFKLSCNASFTVEAAYIMPLVLMCMFIPVWIGIQSQQEIKQWIEVNIQEETMDVITAMYKQDYINNIGGEHNED